jgi:hypothetical protein
VGKLAMEDTILKYGKEIALFALCVYLIWSDRQKDKDLRAFIIQIIGEEKSKEKP